MVALRQSACALMFLYSARIEISLIQLETNLAVEPTLMKLSSYAQRDPASPDFHALHPLTKYATTFRCRRTSTSSAPLPNCRIVTWQPFGSENTLQHPCELPYRSSILCNLDAGQHASLSTEIENTTKVPSYIAAGTSTRTIPVYYQDSATFHDAYIHPPHRHA